MSKTKKQLTKTHTIIISDIHLGSSVAQPRKVLKILQEYSFRKLILLGDVFESLNFKNLSQDGWELLQYIGKLSKTKKIRWVEGNHDKGLSSIVSALVGAKIKKVYQWQYKKEKYLAIHGHQFDRFLIDNVIISYISTILYNILQKIDFKDKRMSRFVKRKSKGWLRISEKIFKSAVLYGKLKGVKYVFCGHTHKAMKKKRYGIKYYNSGCWTDTPCAYITIDEKGVEIHKV
jgi:UDP-2,3-diacylglucosamine pyrophosphatase LpxH